MVFHLLAVTLMAFPAPGGTAMQKSAWANPTVQSEFRAWTGRLNSVGVDLSKDQLEGFLWDFASGYTDAREWVLAPFKPYCRYMGTWQSWRMFVAPHRYPAAVHIDLQRENGGEWEPLYATTDPALRWRGAVLKHDRMRSSSFRYGWKAYRGTYRRFTEWVAREAAKDFVDAYAVRVRLFKYQTRSALDVRAGKEVEGTFEQVSVRRLAGVRDAQAGLP